MAISGKLVPQEDSDETATNLLSKIATKKSLLIKEKKIKAHIYRSEPIEGPYELPSNWCWTTLQDAFILNPQVKADDDDDVAFIPMTLIDAGYQNSYKYETRKWKDVKTGFTKIGLNDVAYAKITPCFQNRKSLILTDAPNGIAAATTELNVIRAIDGTISNKYLYYYLESNFFVDKAKFKGTVGQQRVHVEYASGREFPLPPYNEQLRIVAQIEKCFSLIDILERDSNLLSKTSIQAYNKLLDLAIRGKLVEQRSEESSAQELLKQIADDKLRLIKEKKIKKQEVSAEPVEGDFDLPDTWCWVNINLINQHSGKTVDPSKNKDVDYELYSVPVYESGQPEMLKGAEIGSSKQVVECGDVLLSKINPHLNRVWTVSHHDKDRQCIASSEWVIIRCPQVDSMYLKYALSSKYFLDLMMSNLTGVGGSLTRAQGNCVREYPIPLPPIEEQHRIVAKLNEILPMIDCLRS